MPLCFFSFCTKLLRVHGAALYVTRVDELWGLPTISASPPMPLKVTVVLTFRNYRASGLLVLTTQWGRSLWSRTLLSPKMTSNLFSPWLVAA